MLSYKLSITTQNFLNILYWFEERRNTNDNEGRRQAGGKDFKNTPKKLSANNHSISSVVHLCSHILLNKLYWTF